MTGLRAGDAAGGEPAAVLAIDAGNTKTDVALVAADGGVLGTARGGGFRPSAAGVDSAVDVLAEAVGRALTAAGLAPGHGVHATHVSACLANADLPVEEERLQRAVRERGWGRTTEVVNDTFAVLRAGVDVPHGVAVVCGAGINCVGMTEDGRTARFPAIGRISGDWGGGQGLAEEALWWAARAEDGRGERTALARTLPGHYGLTTMRALIEALHLGRIGAGRKHELVPVLFATAEDGDAIARAIVRRQAEEIATMAAVALERLELLDEETPVVLGGGIVAARRPLLLDAVTELLAARAPKAVPVVTATPPVLGAALLGLDRVAAPAEAHARLRSHYA
ncbi:N-acetylglucosamine kinase [Streptomyces sp. URMC 123]|uniref:N-acetylglucosamine kinase n=1 Tax=Streptomyces sp. URMC 123 TaxID=3423403 RepID=UPI003F1DD1F8